MANTRFNYDPCRTKKKLEESTFLGRYMLDVPGYGDKPCYIEDPQIIIQKWGANLRTNTIELENELLGMTRKANRDCLGINDYEKNNVPSEPIQYPSCNTMYTEQSRAIMPAWTARDLEQVDWYTLPLDPQENTCLPFQSNISTRILEKDYFGLRNNGTPCVYLDKEYDDLPVSSMNQKSFAGGVNLCNNSNTCSKINN